MPDPSWQSLVWERMTEVREPVMVIVILVL